MVSDSMSMDDDRLAARGHLVTVLADGDATHGDSAIGYEAADPTLHAPLWTEAIQASPIPRSLR